MEGLIFYFWIVLFLLMAASLPWFYRAARIVFMLMRRDRTEKEKTEYSRGVIVSVLLVAGSLIIAWLINITTVTALQFYPHAEVGWIFLLVPLVGGTGFFSCISCLLILPEERMKLASVLTAIVFFIWSIMGMSLIFHMYYPGY
jgi:cation transport ATPase